MLSHKPNSDDPRDNRRLITAIISFAAAVIEWLNKHGGDWPF